MAKNCVITLPPAVVDKAAANAHKLGKSLKEVIEDAIVTTAETDTQGPWITERELEKLDWAPSRVTLFSMRREGRLTPGKHYKRKGRFLYYHREKLEEELKTASRVKTAKDEAEGADPELQSPSAPSASSGRDVFTPEPDKIYGPECMGGTDYPEVRL